MVVCRATTSLGSVDYFFFNDPATTEIYTLSLHDALPILSPWVARCRVTPWGASTGRPRSEEHTSELQSRLHLVCRLLLEKKKHACYGSSLPLPGDPDVRVHGARRTLCSSSYISSCSRCTH